MQNSRASAAPPAPRLELRPYAVHLGGIARDRAGGAAPGDGAAFHVGLLRGFEDLQERAFHSLDDALAVLDIGDLDGLGPDLPLLVADPSESPVAARPSWPARASA